MDATMGNSSDAPVRSGAFVSFQESRRRAGSGASASASASSSAQGAFSPGTSPGGSRVIAAASVYLTDSYKRCNPQFGYTSHLNPRRRLTKPAEPGGNGGWDNENQDLIISVSDVLSADDGKSGEFEVRDVLGSGTFGQVVRCRQKGTGRQAAVKVIKNHPAYFHQAHVEIGILHMLNTKCDERDEHHIVRMLDHFVHRSHLCIVFEVLNVNLYELLRQNNFRGLSVKLVRTFVKQLLRALRVLRQADVIHCDLKPENILVKSLDTGEIKLIDFGSACFQNRTVYQYIQSRFYRSPEVVLGSPYGMPIDMWSLGCVVAELFLGLPLFPGASEHNLLTRICETLGPPPDKMLAAASNAKKFFVRVDADAGQNAGGLSQAMSDANDFGRAPPSFRLMTVDEFERKSGKRAAVGKKYFKDTRLDDIVRSAGYTPNQSDEALRAEKSERDALLDLLKGMLRAEPTERWTPDQAMGHPFLIEDAAARAAAISAGLPFIPGPPELAADATDKASKVAREQSAARAAAKVAKQGQASQNAPLPPAPGVVASEPEPATPEIRSGGASAAGGLAAALAAASPTAAQDARRAAAQQQATQQQMVQQQQAMMQQVMAMGTSPMAMAAAAAGAGGFPVGTPTGGGHFAPGSFTGTPGSSFGGAPGQALPYGMSPHALNSAALHPLHFGQSPPSSQVSALGFAAGMQHAAAAAAAAAVQLPTLQPGYPASPAQHGFGFGNPLAAAQFGAQASSHGAAGGSWAGPRSVGGVNDARVVGFAPRQGQPGLTPETLAMGGGSQSSQQSPSHFVQPPGSLSKTRGFALHSVGEEEAGSPEDGAFRGGEMEHDGHARSLSGASGDRGAGGMGERKRSQDALDPADWDPNFSDDLLFDGGADANANAAAQGGNPNPTAAQFAAANAAAVANAAAAANFAASSAGFPGRPQPLGQGAPAFSVFQSQSAPKWSSAGMTGLQLAQAQMQYNIQAANAAALSNTFQAYAQYGSPQQNAQLQNALQFQQRAQQMQQQEAQEQARRAEAEAERQRRGG
jgi:dual specificity protein kinase YAK1